MWARLLACLCVIGAQEQRADFRKRGTRPHHRDEGRLLLEAIAKPLKEDVDELAIRHGIAEFTELVGHGLDTLVVDAEGGGPWTVLRISALRLLTWASTLSWKSWRRS
jgi:hypothetical protein